jgi:lysophospholipase L1-like esterase
VRPSRRLVVGALLAAALVATGSACEYVGAAGTPRVGVAGDSIVHETEAALRSRLSTDHRVTVHAFNNAHFDQLRSPVSEMRRTGAQSIVVAAGSPDVVAATHPDYGFVPVLWIRDVVAAAADVPCLALVTVKENGVAPIATSHWTQGARTINAELRRQADAHANVVLVDWSAKADRHPEWFLGDGLHLNAAGRAGFARVLDRAADC